MTLLQPLQRQLLPRPLRCAPRVPIRGDQQSSTSMHTTLCSSFVQMSWQYSSSVKTHVIIHLIILHHLFDFFSISKQCLRPILHVNRNIHLTYVHFLSFKSPIQRHVHIYMLFTTFRKCFKRRLYFDSFLS